MNFFNNLKVSFKLGALILIALLSMGIIAYTGYYYLQESNTNMSMMYADQLVPIALINENRAHINMVNAAIMELMVTTDDRRDQELKKIIDERAKAFNDNLAEFEKSHLDFTAKEKLTGLKTSMQKYREARSKVIELAMQNKNVEAYALYTATVDSLEKEALNQCIDLSKYAMNMAQKTKAGNQASFEKSGQVTFGIFFASLLLLGLNGFYISKMITKPLSLMVLAAEELATGDFREKVRKLNRKDELGQLANAMAKMRSSLQILMSHINSSSEQLAASSEELTASAEQSAQAANQVAISITEVAKGSERQLGAANDTSAVVQQISASIQQIAANTNEVARQSAQAADKASEGNKAADKAVNQMADIEQAVTFSAQIVSKLGERSKEIGQIVDTISGIAGQTNLLALNAAIEAARAGEQGRGFAVVAEEVRKLAEQSQDAAKQIAALIGEIQSDTDKAVVAMNDGTREVKLGAEIVNASGQAFQEITGLVSQVSDQVKEISSAIDQIAIGSQQIVGSVKQINQLSKTTDGEAQTVSAATEEQSASMEEIASASQSLARLAQGLQEAISKFQI